MFGVLVSGRLPVTNFERVSETQFLIEIKEIENVHHIVVFMTGETPFPNGFAGSVYFSYKIDGGESKWIYLGKLCNQKPSSIFKISNMKHESNHLTITPFGGGSILQDFEQVTSKFTSSAMIGISVEPEAQIDALTPAVESKASNASSYTQFAQKMLENFFNYASSFSKDAPDGQQYFPLSALHTWFENIRRRLELDPNFWKN